ncbi:hypothetical protein DM02DRAFT_670868 [Periconia macrospinosa]|uniref:RING-type domain-containing protein n=1 Tax=Periconia macrospinosa TaxID=97972 RepID=A0A2V1DUD8_9PLEO|nr:hypothetical protein DM02DRAFT_670868 [Periconia macrospinosa]
MEEDSTQVPNATGQNNVSKDDNQLETNQSEPPNMQDMQDHSTDTGEQVDGDDNSEQQNLFNEIFERTFGRLDLASYPTNEAFMSEYRQSLDAEAVASRLFGGTALDPLFAMESMIDALLDLEAENLHPLNPQDTAAIVRNYAVTGEGFRDNASTLEVDPTLVSPEESRKARAFLEQLPVATAEADKESQSESCFCDCDYDGEHPPVRLACGHVFGRSCLLKWVDVGNGNACNCPVCREPFVRETTDTTDERASG